MHLVKTHGLAPLIVLLSVGPLAYLLRQSTGLAWGLGWGLVLAVAWSLYWRPAWGIIWGLSAGLYVGLGTPASWGLLGNLFIGGIGWGLVGGAGGRVWLGIDRDLITDLRDIFYGSLILPFVSGIAVALIGWGFDDFSLDNIGFVIGIFYAMFWGIGGVLGFWLAHLLSNRKTSPTQP